MGVLRVDHDEPEYFTPERARLLLAVGSQTALAIRHAQLLAQEREVAVVAERNRIARELHDAVSQTLFAANVLAGTLVRTAGRGAEADTALLQAQAKALEQLNRGALAEMRMLMFELRPDAFEGTTLAELLKHQLEALECRGDIEVVQSLSSADHLDAATRIQLYRIAQEALTNVARHAHARHVTVEWRALPEGGGRLRIADDGAGFDPDAEVPGHFGLGNMRSRAAEIGAALSLNTAPGAGCEIIVDLT
jgi:signal transduction histidine kinase